MGGVDGLGVDWKMVDLYGKMGVSKIVREIEGSALSRRIVTAGILKVGTYILRWWILPMMICTYQIEIRLFFLRAGSFSSRRQVVEKL